MSSSGDAHASEAGGASLVERLPPGLRERLAGLLDLELAETGWLGEESTRVGANLLALLERAWPEILALGGRVVGWALAGALLVGAAAALAGWLLYLLAAGPLLRRAWRSGRLVGCLAAGGLILCAAAGGGWAGLGLGASRALERAIEEEYVVERIAAAAFLAFTLDEPEIPAALDPAAVQDLLERAQTRSADSWAEFRARAEKATGAAGSGEPGWLRAELLAGAVERLSGSDAPDLAALHAVLSGPVAAAGGEPLPQTSEIRRRAAGLLRASAATQALTTLGFGLGLPFLALVALGLLGCVVNRPAKRRPTPPGAAASRG